MNNIDSNRQNETDNLLSQILPTEVKRGPGRPKQTNTIDNSKTVKTLDASQEVWLKGLIAALSNLQVKSFKDVERCIPIANTVLEEFNKRWK